jgi:hypothetical protein
MEPITTAIITILGKYAIDKGATLIKEAGQAAAEVAAKLFDKVLNRLKADPAEAKNAERFEQNPEGYKAPLADAVDDKLKTDPAFAAELKKLLEEFEQARSAAGFSGAIATQGSVAAGAAGAAASSGGVAVAGDVHGSISVDNRRTQIDDHSTTINRSGGVDINANDVDIGGDLTGRDKITSDK